MARASTYTLLPLDRWAHWLQFDPRHFNGLVTDLDPANNCKEAWLQYAWQSSDKVSREEVAAAIQQAEDDVVGVLGYSPVPQWIAGEVKRVTQPYNVASLGTGLTPAGRAVSVTTDFGHVISGGVQTKTAIGPGVAVAWSDADGDGYKETATVTAATTATDTGEIRVYYPGEWGADEWEIRPLRKVTIAGGFVTVLIDRHLLVKPGLMEAIDARDVDGDVDGNFVATVDVYRVYNDYSQQAQLDWERIPNSCGCGESTCPECAWATQAACLQVRDPRAGFVTYRPATWNATTEVYDVACQSVARQPERVRLWYYAGYRSSRVRRPLVEIDPMLEQAITYHSICLLDRPVCNCDNVETIWSRWTHDRALSGEESFQLSAGELACPWSRREGDLRAWAMLHRLRADMLPVERAVEY